MFFHVLSRLSKEDKRLMKEEEKKQKELKKLELQREKERKKKEETRSKNRQKSLKNFKVSLYRNCHITVCIYLQDYKLPENYRPLYCVEVTESQKGSKDHLTVTKGETLSVILFTHPKLPSGKYLAENDDGLSTVNITLINVLYFV